ncbi:MAG: hypothetical protein QOF58_2952 [Pseudonocardiales bacterium]|jgi:hypothetical protein|nr:hypothetical protein [Pseudonocardiales bacterium]
MTMTHDVPATGQNSRGPFEALLPAETLTEQTILMSPVVEPSQPAEVEAAERTGLGWTRPLWHRLETAGRPYELRDPQNIHGKRGGWFVVSDCGMFACPDPMVADVLADECPVCFPDESGHNFVWEGHTRARCIRAGCGQYDDELRDPNTGRRQRCEPAPSAVRPEA